ncbi:MAG: hypothetical protein KDK65_01345 [Chlamydiia bacterium]|nr:hypothetical protein [Chlamydiia bacterium]
MWRGIKLLKTHTVALPTLALFPVVIAIWSLSALISHYGASQLPLWFGGMGVGILLGMWSVRRLSVTTDGQQLTISGDVIPLLLSLAIFVVRFGIEAASEIVPTFSGSALCMGLECVAAVIAGAFWGRLIAFIKIARRNARPTRD